jgi:uncharacterized delta-60 repeat protein
MSLITNKLRMASRKPLYGNPPHWIAEQTDGSSSKIAGVAVDSLDNIISVGRIASFGAGNGDLCINKFNTNGSLLWTRTLGQTTTDAAEGVTIDSNDNIIVCGSLKTGNFPDAIIAKYNSSGNFLWARTLSNSNIQEYYSVTTDGSDNIIAVGRHVTSASSSQCLIAKYTPDGNLSWSNLLGAAGFDQASGVATDSDNNIYIAGYSESLGTFYNFFLAKFNSSGTYQWGRKTQYGSASGVKVDKTSNVYVVGRENFNSPLTNTFLLKYNSSGTLLYKLRFGNSADSEYSVGIDIDRSDNLIMVGQVGSAALGRLYVTKRTSSGTQIWSRTLRTASNVETGYSVAIDSTDNIIVGGIAKSTSPITVKLHPDGIGTGTYSGYIYAAANVENISGTSGLSASITEFTSAISGLDNSAPSVSNALAIPTTTLITIA